jgi:hypothetical protein
MLRRYITNRKWKIKMGAILTYRESKTTPLESRRMLFSSKKTIEIH